MKKSNKNLDLGKNIKNTESTQIIKNVQSTQELASSLFPGERWINIDQHIFRAASRTPRSRNQSKILEKELAQARILTALGHIVYLLPEFGPQKTKHPDAIVDGKIMEFKTVSGNKKKIDENYKKAREKSENVFLQINPHYSHKTVAGRLSDIIRRKCYKSGLVWIYFKHTGKMVYWTVEGLK